MSTSTELQATLTANPLFDLLSKNPDGYFVINDKHLILYANTMAQSFVGLPAKQLLGQKIMLSFSVDENIEIHYKNTAGQSRLLDVWAVKVSLGKQSLFLIRVRDLSLRELPSHTFSEESTPFKQLVENIKETFWLTNHDYTKVLYVSPTYEKIWGRRRASLYENPAS